MRQKWSPSFRAALCASVVGLGLGTAATAAVPGNAAEAFVVNRQNFAERPQGKEADGIVGDFVLRNDKVEALISGSQPMRRNSTWVGKSPVEQGVLYDFDIRGARNDQIATFQPGALQDPVSYVRMLEPQPNGGAAIEVVRYAASGNGLYTRHEYRLEPGWSHILVVSTYRNESTAPIKVTLAPVWSRYNSEYAIGAAKIGDSIDPEDKRAYAAGPAPGSSQDAEVTLQPGETRTQETLLTLGDSPLAAYGAYRALVGPTGTVDGSAVDASGAPAVHATITVKVDGQALPAYPDAKGRIAFNLPPGQYQADFTDIGRDPISRTLTVAENGRVELGLRPSTASGVDIDVRDQDGKKSPARVMFIGVRGTKDPNLGPDWRAHGAVNSYSTHDGTVRQQLPPGDYLVRITRGIEFDVTERTISVRKGRTTAFSAVVKRSLDTSGWISTDFHAHTTLSGGGDILAVDDRIINFAAEGLEFVPTTEHAMFADWTPNIERLGLSDIMKTVVGIEQTVDSADLTAFPFIPDPYSQDGGAPPLAWDPRINAIMLRDWSTPSRYPGGSLFDTSENWRLRIPYFGGSEERWVHLNHPVVGNVFWDRDGDTVPDGGYANLESFFDAGEFFSSEILSDKPIFTAHNFDGSQRFNGFQNRTFAWLQLLNQGRKIWMIATSDPHRVYGNGAGSWRTYIPVSAKSPKDLNVLELVRNARKGQMMLTNGPYLEVTTDDGLPIGSSITRKGGVTLKIRVQANNAIDVDRVQILVNGRKDPAYNFTRAEFPQDFKSGVVRFEKTVPVKLDKDAHLIVVATSDHSDLSKFWGLTTYGSNYGSMPPLAYTNPIYVDVDGDGFKPNGDTLGEPLPTTPPEHLIRGGTSH